MSEMGLVMDEEVRLEFGNLNVKLDNFILAQTRLCGERGTELGMLKQRLDNGEKHEDKDIKRRTLKFSYDRLIVTVVVGGFGIWQVVKELLVR